MRSNNSVSTTKSVQLMILGISDTVPGSFLVLKEALVMHVLARGVEGGGADTMIGESLASPVKNNAKITKK